MKEWAESLSNGGKEEYFCPAKNAVVHRVPVGLQEHFKSGQ